MSYGAIVVDGSGHMGRAPEGGGGNAAYCVSYGLVVEPHAIADLLGRPPGFGQAHHLIALAG